MAYDGYGGLKVKAEPEVFWIAWLDSLLPNGSFMKRSDDLKENDPRAKLANMQHTQAGKQLPGLV